MGQGAFALSANGKNTHTLTAKISLQGKSLGEVPL